MQIALGANEALGIYYGWPSIKHHFGFLYLLSCIRPEWQLEAGLGRRASE